MRKVLSRSLMTAAATTGALVAAAGYAQADSGAQGGAADSPGVLSGNSVQAPVEAPVNACGNSVSVVGVLNPVFGNSCGNNGVLAPPPGGGPQNGGGDEQRAEEPAERPAPERAEPAAGEPRQSSSEAERSGPAERAPAAEEAPAAQQDPGAPSPAGASTGASFAGQALAETGTVGTGTAAAVGAGVLLGGVVLYRRASRRRT